MERDEKYLEQSKKRLFDSIKKKILTAAVGSINHFEDKFGDLWGINKTEKLTSDELEFKNQWEEIRAKIFDLANLQIKNISKELDSYDIDWNSITHEIRPRNGRATI